MTPESPQERIARLEWELAQARAEQDRRGHRPVTDTDTWLSAPPRRVPLGLRLGFLRWRWWEAFTLVMVAVSPIALWLFVPWSAAMAGAVTIVVAAGLRWRSWRGTSGLLRWGAVATVTGAQRQLNGLNAYYNNMRLPRARGWEVTTQWYTGPRVVTLVSYRLNGVDGTVTVKGLPYEDGVILADTRRPAVAACISSLPRGLRRDAAGDWEATVSPGALIGMTATVVVYAAWIAGCVYLATAGLPGLL